MPVYDVHPAKLVDLPAVRRMADKGTILDSELCYTRSIADSRSAFISSILLPQRGLFTLVGRMEDAVISGQVRIKYADHLAQIVYIAPGLQPEHSDTAWLALLDAMAAEVGRRGALMLTAEIDEVSPLFPTMRQAGFAVYARQEIFRRAAGTPTQTGRLPILGGVIADETDDDAMDIQLLYSNIVPRLVQPIAVPSPESTGMVYRRGGRVQAYIAISQGRQGIYLMPFMHPDVIGREATGIIEAVLGRIERTDRWPVYVCVRRYQDWLGDMLKTCGFESWTQQAVMVRHIAAGIRQPAFSLPAAAQVAMKPSVSSPFQHSSLDPDTGDQSPPYGATNH
jgi:hypothetical protein